MNVETKTIKLYSLVLFFTMIGIAIALREEEKFSILKKDFKNPVFLGALALIVVITIINLIFGNKSLRNATQHALIAFIVSYLACLNMPFLVFFIVGGYVYYTGTDL